MKKTAAHGTHTYRNALKKWTLSTTAAATLNTCFSWDQKKYETLYFSVSLSQRSITYASLEDVRGGEVVESYRTVILYCNGEGVNEVILLSWCCFLFVPWHEMQGGEWTQTRSKAVWTIGSKRQSQLCALSASSSCGLRSYMK